MCEKCAKVDEMIGKKFGKLTVLERVENSSGRQKRYLCECKCGNRKIIIKSSLVHGRTKSCGKCNEIKPGAKFGLLTVIKKSDKKDKKYRYFFECRCECGNIIFVRGDSLKNGLSESCGRCKEPKPGDKFGLLTVIKKSDKKDRTKNHYFECRCECGNIILTRSFNLREGSTKSCGCLGSSSGEFEIYNFLDANFISYTREREIIELVTSKGGHPRFDFEIFDKYGDSFFLEFHGGQHYWPIKNSEFGKLQREETDPMKIQYCEENGRSLHVINEFEDVESSLTRILYYREMLTPERLERNKTVYKLKRTLFTDKNGHLSIFSDREEFRAAA